MSQKLHPALKLPEWARWHAWLELRPNLQVQILELNYPSWGESYYPIYLDQNLQPLFSFPKDIGEAAKDGRIWSNCPDTIYFSEKSGQIVVDHVWEGDHPRPAGAERRLISPPDFKTAISESLRASYGSDLRDPRGDLPPRLSALGADFQPRTIRHFGRKAPGR